MRCHRQPVFLQNKPTPITDLWEVRISSTFWTKIRNLAKQRKTTFSTISRYCIFRLIEPERLRKFRLFSTANSRINDEMHSTVHQHRHLICFYGEDIKLVRLAAMQLNMTVSALIRIALWLYLPRLEMDTNHSPSISPEQLFLLGTKRWMLIPYAALNIQASPTIRRFAFASFPPWFWW